MEPGSTNKRLKNLLVKVSNFTNIIPYLGHYDQVYLLYMRLCKETKQVFDESKDLILIGCKRIHPYFVDELKKIESTTQKGINMTNAPYCHQSCPIFLEQFLAPPIEVHAYNDPDKNLRLFECPVEKANFTKIYVNNWNGNQTNNFFGRLLELPNISKDILKVSTSQVNPESDFHEVVPYYEKADYYVYNNPDTCETTLERFDSIGKEIRHILIPSAPVETEEFKVSDTFANSMEEATIRFSSNEIDSDFRIQSNLLVGVFPNLKTIRYETSRNSGDTILGFFKSINGTKVNEKLINQKGEKITEIWNVPRGYLTQCGLETCIKGRLDGIIGLNDTSDMHYFEDSDKEDPSKFVFTESAGISTFEFNNQKYIQISNTCQKLFEGKFDVSDAPPFLPEDNFNLLDFSSKFFIPVKNIDKISIKRNGKYEEEMKVYESQLDYIYSLHNAKIDLSVSDPQCSGRAGEFVTNLNTMNLDSLDLDLSYTSIELFEGLLRYLSSENLPKSLKIHAFSQHQFEKILDTLSENKNKPRTIQVVLHSEAMIRIQDVIYKFQLQNPFTDLIVRFFSLAFSTPRSGSFTVKSLIEKFKKSKTD